VAVIIGGASFRGGEGRLRDTAIGVAFLAVLNNGLSGLQMSDATFYLVKGGGILAALVLQTALATLPARQRTAAHAPADGNPPVQNKRDGNEDRQA
jgi:ribose/xylose/arabinose/galactoside ABC-type transport system permease subunit